MKWSGSYLFGGEIVIHPKENIHFQARFFFFLITVTKHTFTAFQEFVYIIKLINILLCANPNQHTGFPNIGYSLCLFVINQSMYSKENINTDISID